MNKSIRITIVAGARPNFMKIAPIIHSIKNLENKAVSYRLVHTGQHFDHDMSDSFFKELKIPEPDINLGVNGGSQAEQTAGIMIEFEKELIANPSDLVLVVGDVTSTMACAIVAKKLNIKVAHVEAGIRSFDLTMPEEINRMVTDSITDYFFTTSVYANKNLINAGISEDQIFFVGNVMVDTLLANKSNFVKPDVYDELNLSANNYFVLTLHRPANVDEHKKLQDLLKEIVTNAEGMPVIFPVHPRTRKILETIDINYPNLFFVKPLSYLKFNYLVKNSLAVITDSGGITEETTVMNIPCLTLRDSTERPETCEVGTNELIGNDLAKMKTALKKIINGTWKKGQRPEKWDGKASIRIIDEIQKIFRLQ